MVGHRRTCVVALAALVLLGGCGRQITTRQARDRQVSADRLPQFSGSSSSTQILATLAQAAAQLDEPRRQLVEVALAMAGRPASGLDCSSFAGLVYQTISAPLPRTVRQQWETGDPLRRSDLQPGDLVFFAFKNRPADHVGIYVGQGAFVHVSSSAKSVRIETLSHSAFARVYVGNRRFLSRSGSSFK